MPNPLLPVMPPGVPHLVANQGRHLPPRVVRPLSNEEKAAVMRSTEVVMSLTPERLITPLRTASEAALREWILALRAGNPRVPAIPEDLTYLEAALRGWLSHFRAFIDHTAGLLSRYFGADAKAGFERLTNATFDRNAAYLLACGLRNYSQHQGEIVNYRTVESSQAVRGQPFTFQPVLGIIPSQALGKNSGKTRREMRAATYPVRIDRFVAEVMNECERLLIETYVLIREPLEEHVKRIEALVREAGEPDRRVMIMTLSPSGAVEGTEFGNFECPAREMFDFIYKAVDAALPPEGEPDPPVTMRDLFRPA